MIAAQDEEMTIAAKALYEKNQDKYARIWAQAHEDFLWEDRMLINRVKNAEKNAEEKAEKKAEQAIKEAESKAQQTIKEAEAKAQRYRELLIANNIDPDSDIE